MNKTKDKVILELLAIIFILISLWIYTIILFLEQAKEVYKKENIIQKQEYEINTLQLHKNINIINYMSGDRNSIQEEPDNTEDNKIYLGKFKITHYCACKKCCGENAQGITASGKKVQENKTIAVDTKVIKMGSKVLIDGYGEYEAQDTGSAIKGNVIDVYVADHEQAQKMGVVYKNVYLVKGELL